MYARAGAGPPPTVTLSKKVGPAGSVSCCGTPTRAYIDELLPEVMDGRIQPGRVFDRTVGLDGVPDGYRAMNDREALKVLVRP